MHDYSYYLGFTERNYNLQLDNLGRGGVEGDPEVGNAQAGALTGGQPTYLGRDNANQITLQDGVPGITNQYLFQPIAGAFYAPCTDGGLDMSIVGHEYTHAISNRMVGGPDEGLTSEQGGAMGESWGDLVAAEYLFSHGYSTGANPWVVGAVRHRQHDVRHPRLRDQPEPAQLLATTGSTPPGSRSTPTARSGTARSGRSARRWWRSANAKYPYSDRALQLRCAQGRQRQDAAPGRPVPRQPALDPADVRLVPAPAGRHVDAGRPRRDARRRPDALRRRRPQGHLGRVRPPRHGQGRLDAQRRLAASRAELRVTARPQRDR